MNRGRHKKSNKEKESYTRSEILRNIEKELQILLKLYESKKQSIIEEYNATDYYARAYMNNKSSRFMITSWFISDAYYIRDFLSRVNRALCLATVKNSIYSIEFIYGGKTKIFKYKA